MIKGMIKWTVVLSVTFLLLFHVWKILIFTCSLPYGLFWSASQSPDEYKLMWILTDLMSFVLILLIFFFHRWKTHTHTRTHTYLASNTSNLYSDVIAMFRSLSRWKCVFRWRERELAFCTGSRIKLEGGTYSKFKKGNLP